MKSEKHLNQIENLREKGKHKQAYDLVNKLIWESVKANDFLVLASAYGQRSYIWKHLAQLEKNQTFDELASIDAEMMLRLAKDYNLREILHTAHFIHAKTELAKKDYTKAVDYYKEALRNYRGTESEKGDWLCHLGFAEYLAGNKERGRELIKSGIKTLEKNLGEVNTFLSNVWLSGAYMRLAEALWQDEPETASESLKKAQKIIQSNKQLIIRKKQIKLLKEKLKESKK